VVRFCTVIFCYLNFCFLPTLKNISTFGNEILDFFLKNKELKNAYKKHLNYLSTGS
jgi:hypothetical protein